MIGLKKQFHKDFDLNIVLDNFKKHKIKLLELSYQDLLKELKFFSEIENLTLGIELECYLLNLDKTKPNINQIIKFIDHANNNLVISNIAKVSKEYGDNQIEFSTKIYLNPFELCEDIEKLKIIICDLAIKENLLVDFTSQLYQNDCGSSTQFNISFKTFEGNNFFYLNNKIDLFSSTLLDYTNQMLFILAPNHNDYIRFDLEINKNIFLLGKYPAPINLSYGYDNRTCAIRIPKINKKNCDERIEYRVPSSKCDHWISLSAIFLSLSRFKYQSKIYTKIYGNAFDEHYQNKKIINDFNLSKNIFILENNYIFLKLLDYLNM